MHPLIQKIAALQRRLTLRERAVAACWTAATIIAAALLLGLIDYLVHFADPGLRLMATAALVAAAAWAVYRWWYLPSRHRLVPLAVARRVEAQFPQLRDSLASSIEFLQQSEDDHTAGSAQLRRLVVTEAETAVEGLPLEKVIDHRPLRRAAAWLAVAGFVVTLCLAWDARAVGTALARLAAPLGSTEWPRQHHLAFRDAPAQIAAGATFEVELVNTAGELPDEVRIEYRTDSAGRRQLASEPMSRVGDAMIARRENVRQSFAFRAIGGDDDTMRWHRVEVVEPPRWESLAITVHPPAYTGLPSRSVDQHLQVLAGTGIEIRGTATGPLSAARILTDSTEPIAAEIDDDPAGNGRRAFRIAPEQWIATKSGSYRLELADDKGVSGVVGQWNLRTQPDSPPSVSWQRPSDDLYVTPAAVVPIEVVVKDNLAIHRVELVYERSDRPEAERERESTELRIELYRGSDQPEAMSTDATSAPGESRVVQYTWDFTLLKLPVGAELILHAEAADYRPGVGRTVVPRRITIITADELEARLADQQAQIVRQLERALAVQQTTREDIRRMETHELNDDGLADVDRNALQSAELNQRRVGRMLVDPAEGVPALVDAMLAEIEMNRLAGSELRATLDRLSAELARLASGPLNIAERELTAARKAIETQADSRLPQSLSTAGTAQDDVIATLERLAGELSGKADYRRFTRLLAELRQDQIAHEESARAQIGLETLPLRVNELSQAQRAKLNHAATGQNALAARFEKIEHGMDRLAQDVQDENSEAAARLTEAVTLARRLAIGTKMQESARDLSENRVGQALSRESQIADDLQRVLDVLHDARERQSEQVAENLRAAEDHLAELREQLANLRQQIAQAEREPDTADNKRQLEQLSQEQDALRRDIEQLAQQLQSLQADAASRSTQSAANRLDNRESDDNRPSTSREVQQAEQDLEEAARQLAEQRQQAEDDLVLEFVRRFQAELTEMVERQQQVIEQTVQLDGERQPSEPLSDAAAQAVTKLADEERQLAQLAREHSELLYGLGAVRVSLEEAERRLAAAAELLDERDTGPRAQQAERQALARLEGMMEAFAQTAAEAGQNQQDQPDDADAAAGDQPQRRPTFELLELKMLRMLQVELHERTREYQQQLAALNGPPNDRQRAEFDRESRELAAEQGRLAELVENMLARDNEEDE